jgi:hypothetical protein
MLKAHIGTHCTIWIHWDTQDLEFCTKGEKWSASLPHSQRAGEKEIEGEKREVLLTERGRGRAHAHDRRRVTAGEGRSPARRSGRREQRAQREMSLWLGLGLEAFF